MLEVTCFLLLKIHFIIIVNLCLEKKDKKQMVFTAVIIERFREAAQARNPWRKDLSRSVKIKCGQGEGSYTLSQYGRGLG